MWGADLIEEGAAGQMKGAMRLPVSVGGALMPDAHLGYGLRGRGNEGSINSASHGAGRLTSRTQAFQSISEEVWRSYLAERGVTLIGGSLDEAPIAYKDVETVVSLQGDLVDLVGRFDPKIVRMDPPRSPGDPERSKTPSTHSARGRLFGAVVYLTHQSPLIAS